MAGISVMPHPLLCIKKFKVISCYRGSIFKRHFIPWLKAEVKTHTMEYQVGFIICLSLLLGLSDARTLLRSAPQMCPIDQGNLLDVQLFVKGGNECFNLCEKKEDCNFFRQALLFPCILKKRKTF